MTDDRLIECLRARTNPGDCEAAAFRIEELRARVAELALQSDALLAAMQEAREALQFANESPGGPITDTIWMMHRPETLFDLIDAALEVQPAESEGGK